jgi:hypothetical protein
LIIDCVGFRADIGKPAILAIVGLMLIGAISNKHRKFGFVTDNFHWQFSFLMKKSVHPEWW